MAASIENWTEKGAAADDSNIDDMDEDQLGVDEVNISPSHLPYYHTPFFTPPPPPALMGIRKSFDPLILYNPPIISNSSPPAGSYRNTVPHHYSHNQAKTPYYPRAREISYAPTFFFAILLLASPTMTAAEKKKKKKTGAVGWDHEREVTGEVVPWDLGGWGGRWRWFVEEVGGGGD